ncbi:MAG: amidohydrolase family protein [Candidatus Omnitrophota bacterium]
MIIDSLTHITPDGSWFGTNHSATLPRLMSEMERASVDQALLVGNPALSDNAWVRKTCADHPDRLIPIAAITREMIRSGTVDALLSELKMQGFRGIKIHPRALELSIVSDEVEQIVHAAGIHRLPVLLCTVHRPPAPVLKRPLYDAIHELCGRHRDTRFILLHGGYYELLAVSEIIRPYEHVLLDLSLTVIRFLETSVGNDIRFLVKTFDRRLAVGSDFPEHTFGEVLHAFEKLGFSKAELENRGILGTQLHRFLTD